MQSRNREAGKGSKQRLVQDKQKFEENWDRIFKQKEFKQECLGFYTDGNSLAQQCEHYREKGIYNCAFFLNHNCDDIV